MHKVSLAREDIVLISHLASAKRENHKMLQDKILPVCSQLAYEREMVPGYATETQPKKWAHSQPY